MRKPEPPDEGPADRVMRAVRASYPAPAPSLADEIADCETRAAAGGPNAAAYARRAAELHELASHSGIEGFWQLATKLGNPDAGAYVQQPLPADAHGFAIVHDGLTTEDAIAILAVCKAEPTVPGGCGACRCINTSQHELPYGTPGTDHACECGFTWGDPAVQRGKCSDTAN